MKYLNSAMISQAHPLVRPRSLPIVKYVGIVIYCVIMLILYLTNMISYPGTSDFHAYIAWITGPGLHVRIASHFTFFIFCFTAAGITLYSIFTLQQTVRILRKSNPHLKLSFCNVYVAQATYYTLQFLLALGYLLADYSVLSRAQLFYMNYLIPVFDLCGQLLICYICWT